MSKNLLTLATAGLALALAVSPAVSADMRYLAEAENDQSYHDDRARRMTGTPATFPCTVVEGVYSRPELAEAWSMIRASTNVSEARSRLLSQFRRFPIIFDGCTENGQKVRTVIHDVRVDPFLATAMMPRLTVMVEITSPPNNFGGVRAIGIDLVPMGPVQ